MEKKEQFRFIWERAMTFQPDIQPTTKHVLLTLAVFMDEKAVCFPSVTLLSERTGLSRRSICTHLEKAVNAGWIKKTVAGFNGQGWKRNKYTAITPDKAVNEVDHVTGKVVNEVHCDMGKVVNEVHCVAGEGGEPNDIKVVNEVHTNTTLNTTIKDIYAVVKYLNEKTGTNYRPTTLKTQAFIKARLSEGFSEEDFKKVIDYKCAEWKDDTEYYKYLRPQTLFGTKFESYLQNAAAQPKKKTQQPRN